MDPMGFTDGCTWSILDGWIRREAGTRTIPAPWPCYALVAVIDGGIRVEGVRRTPSDAGGRSVFLIPPDLHALRSIAAGVRWSCILFDPRPVRHAPIVRPGKPSWECARHLPAPGSVPGPGPLWGVDLPVRVPPDLAHDAYTAAQRMADLWWRSVGSRLRAEAMLGSLVMDLVVEAERSAMGPAPEAPDRLVARAERFIRQRLPNPVTVGEVAAHLGLDRSYFTRRYTAHCHRGPGEFIRLQRLRLAEDLLRQGMSATRAATAAGFSGFAALARVFRSVHGTTPGEWVRRG